MTRSYFLDYVTDWYELIDLCREHSCDICDDIIDDAMLDECVDADISNVDLGWRSIRDYLDSIPTGYDYYRYDGTLDYVGLDGDDFEDYKSRVLDWMDEDSLWDEEGEEAGESSSDCDFFSAQKSEGEDREPAEPPVEEEDFSVGDLMSMCGAELVSIRQIMKQNEELKEFEDVSFIFQF